MRLRAADPKIPIVLMTAKASVQVAVEAVARGATDFIGKPFDIAAVVGLLRRYLDARREADAAEGSEEPEQDFSRSGLVGRSTRDGAGLQADRAGRPHRCARCWSWANPAPAKSWWRAPFTISANGRTGLFSPSIVPVSPTRCSNPSCSGIRADAFTGADRDRSGLFEAADGGTLFLDELASTSPAFQASLLRVLQSGEVRRVGSTQTRRVNVRVIGASNPPLQKLVAAGSFRADLYYRLSVLSIELPPLRRARRRRGTADDPFPAPVATRRHAAALDAGSRRSAGRARFPRQCAGTGKRAAPRPGTVFRRAHHHRLPAAGDRRAPPARDCRLRAWRTRLIADRPTMDELQRRYLLLMLEENGWNRRRAAAVLNLDRRTIQRLIARYQFQGAPDPEEDADMEAGH